MIRPPESSAAPPAHPISDLADDVKLENDSTAALLGRQTVALLRQLPEPQRQCLMLAYWDGYNVAQIASHLDIPVEIVKARFTAALRDLRQLITSKGL